MSTHTQPTTTTAGDPGQRILAVLRTRLRAARTAELARATGLTEFEVLDALYELERDGLVTPTVWRITDDGVDHV
jgi:DNA-binding Lrp family transcriptional regulator